MLHPKDATTLEMAALGKQANDGILIQTFWGNKSSQFLLRQL
jgi:hypothetical protein